MELCTALLTVSTLFPLSAPVAGVGAGSCTDPVTPCPQGANSSQLPPDPGTPGPYGDSYGTPVGGCPTCVADPQMPGGPGCINSEWSSLPGPNAVAPLQVLKFQPPVRGASLVQAELHLRGTMCGVLRLENRDPINLCQASMMLAAQLSLAPVPGQGLDSLVLPPLTVEDNQVVTLGPFDGTVDFQHTPPPATNPSGFPSGTVHVSSTIVEERCVRITDPVQLAAFVDGDPGDSFVLFDHTAIDASSVNGCAPLTFKSDPFAGIEVDIVYTYCVPQELVCVGPGDVSGSVGEELVLHWTGTGGSPLDFTVTGLPAGAVVMPNPSAGPYPSPLEVTVTWTPANNQTGTFEICTTFSDDFGQTSECCASVLASECHLLVADGSGNTVVDIAGHPYQTQLRGVRHTFPLVVGDGPSFPVGPLTGQPHSTALPVNRFAVQVVMFNPPIFPSNPEQYTNPLAVTVWSDGRVTARPFGTANNMVIDMEVYADDAGNRFFTFPFEVLNWH